MVVDLPNVRSIVFKEHEGSYLVGMLAAMASKTGKVGFVGGMDIPLIRKFACGYVQGVKAVNPDIRGLPEHDRRHGRGVERSGEGRRAGEEPDRAGADVVYHAAGGTGMGVLQAAADAGKLGIGVDSNQNYLHPGIGADLDAEARRQRRLQWPSWTRKNGKLRRWRACRCSASPQDGVGWALDDNNKSLITDEQKAGRRRQGEDRRRARSRCTTTWRTTPAR